MVKIFVDDERECPQGFICAKTFEEAQRVLLENKGNIEFLSLDNDLNQGFNKNGMYLIPFMIQNQIYPLHINCHTGMFPLLMAEAVQDYLPQVEVVTTHPAEVVMTLRF